SPAHPTQRDQYVCRAARRAVGMPPLPRRQCIQRLNSHGRSEERRRTRTRRSSSSRAARSLWYSGCAHPSGGRGGLAAAAVACPPRWPPPESKQASTSRHSERRRHKCTITQSDPGQNDIRQEHEILRRPT
ncbi:unnamed protein product, partial [Prorocentrum cordatum]